MEPKIALVTAPNSKTGRRVVELLQSSSCLVRIASRNTRIKFDWDDMTTWETVVTGVDCAYIIIPPNLAFKDMPERLKIFMMFCEEKKVSRIVLLSGRGEAEANRCEEIVLASKIPSTIVKASWFSQNFSEGFFLDSIVGGEIFIPVDGVSEPFIDVNDIAEVVYLSLLDTSPENHIYELTGSELLTFEDIASIFSQTLDFDVKATYVPLEPYLSTLRKLAFSDDEVVLTRYLFEELLDGRNSYLTKDVKTLLGREPTSFQRYVESTKNSDVWNRLTLKETKNAN